MISSFKFCTGWRQYPLTFVAKFALAGVLVAGLSACSVSPRALVSAKPDTHVYSMPGVETSTAAARAGAAYQNDPRDPRAGIAYGKALRELGQPGQAVIVLARSANHNPTDSGVLSEYAKALTAAGKADESLIIFTQARKLNPNDWTLISAHGIAFDQIGRHKEARAQYQAALAMKPNHPDLMTNMALSHALSGNLSASEALLRKAARDPAAGAQVRQNLALVLAMRGRFDEAEHMMADLDPEMAEANLVAMREIFDVPAQWAATSKTAPVTAVATGKIGENIAPVASAAPKRATIAAATTNAAKPAPASSAMPHPKPALKPAGTTAHVRKRPAVAKRPGQKSSAVIDRRNTQRVPAAQSTPRAYPMPNGSHGNGPDMTFFSFGY